jgi:hypothetical protein
MLIKNYNYWSKDEIDKLIQLSGTMSFESMTNHFSNRTAASLQKKSIKLGFSSDFKHREFSHDTAFFSTINPLNAYYAGFLAGDGNIDDFNRVTVSLATKDVDILERFKKFCNFTGNVKTYERIKYKNPNLKSVSTLSICGAKQWVNDLKQNFNVTSRKTYTIQPPIINDILSLYSYIIGLIDADGWICINNIKKHKRPCIGVVGASYPLLDWFKEKIEFLIKDDIFYGSHLIQQPKIENKKDYFYYVNGGLRALLILNILKDFPLPKLERKWNNPEINEILEKAKQKHPELFQKYNFEAFCINNSIKPEDIKNMTNKFQSIFPNNNPLCNPN